MLPTVEHPHRGRVRVFGSPLRLSDSPVRESVAPAPALGEHTRAVLRERLGLSEEELDALAAAGAISATR
jgi:crotonobetainyl-CoA:carnitine CoA-transferase CaiB-like acyl-CoA transferase